MYGRDRAPKNAKRAPERGKWETDKIVISMAIQLHAKSTGANISFQFVYFSTTTTKTPESACQNKNITGAQTS